MDSSGDYKPAAVFHSLDQVLVALCQAEIRKLPEVQKLLEIGVTSGVLCQNESGDFQKNISEAVKKRNSEPNKYPFIVLEGLDGCGKTTQVRRLSKKLGWRELRTPPPSITDLREFFQDLPESAKRAYYSLGNYIVAEEIANMNEPIIMDRFWHSTAAYAYANLMKSGDWKIHHSEEDSKWPFDLLKPSIVMFLYLDEKERIRRHSVRMETNNGTNTIEEQTLATDSEFRNNVRKFYNQIQGPTFVEVNVNGTKKDCEDKILNIVKVEFSQFISLEVVKQN